MIEDDKGPSWKNHLKKKVEKRKLADYLRISLILVLLFFLFNYFLPKNSIAKAKLGAARWPWSIKKHLQLSQELFNNGYQHEALEEYSKSEKLYQAFSFLDFNQIRKKELETTKELVYQPEIIKEKINLYQTILQSKPYFRDLLLQLSLLNYKIYENEKAEEYWQQAFYLGPNNNTVQELGKLIKIN